MLVSDFVGKLGSLDNGTASEGLRSDRLPYKRNVEHARGAAQTKRPGKIPLARVADFVANGEAYAPNLSKVAGSSSLTNGTLYARTTYSTVAGESDDKWATTASIAVNSGDVVTATCLFHIFQRRVVRHDIAAGTIEIESALSGAVQDPAWFSTVSNDDFNNWNVYCRNPRIQDETKLGVNPDLRKLWDRLDPLAVVSGSAVAANDGGAYVITLTLQPAPQVSLVGEYVDIMMPDRAGLPVRAVNLYVSQGPVGPFYWAGSASPTAPTSFTVSAVDTSAVEAPSSRTSRGNGGGRAGAGGREVTDPTTGVVTLTPTGIPGGVYQFRTAYETSATAVLDNGAWPEASSYGLGPRPRQSSQFIWPSACSRVAVCDGDSIWLGLPEDPNGNPIVLTVPDYAHAQRVYGKVVAPTSTYTFAGVTSPSSTHRAYYTKNHSGPALTSAILALSPSAFRADAHVSELTTGNYTAIGAIGLTTLAPDAADWATEPVYKVQLESQAAEVSTASHACVMLKMRTYPGRAYDPAQRPLITVRYWDNNAASWVSLKTNISTTLSNELAAGLPSEWTAIRLAWAWTSTMAESGRIVWDVSCVGGGLFNIDYAIAETYVTPADTGPDGETLVQVAGPREWPIIIQHPLIATSQSEPVRANTTGQWPCTQYPAYLGDAAVSARKPLQHVVGCADSVFIAENGALKRIYQHERLDGITSKATLDVAARRWRFGNVLNRIYLMNPANDLGIDLRFDGVQTHGAGVMDAGGSGSTPPGDGDDGGGGDPPPPGGGSGRYHVTPRWAPEPQTGRPRWLPEHRTTGELSDEDPENDYIEPFWVNRWLVNIYPSTTETPNEGGSLYVYDWRDTSWMTEAERSKVAELGGTGKLVAMSKITHTMTSFSIVTGGHVEGVIAHLLLNYPTVPLTQGVTQAAFAAVVQGASDPTTGQPSGSVVIGSVAGEVPLGVKDYYAVCVREVERVGQPGYTSRSRPVKLGTVTTTAALSSVVARALRPNDPSVVAMEFYRTMTDSASVARRIAEVRLDGSTVDASGYVTLTDTLADEKLTLLLDFDSGPPPASSVTCWQNGRRWGVPLFNPQAIWWSRPTDPESHLGYSIMIAPFEKSCDVTALVPFGEKVLGHGDNGIVYSFGSTEGLLSSDPIGFKPISVDRGAIGPFVCLNLKGTHYYATSGGIHAMSGGGATDMSKLIGGTIKSMRKDSRSAEAMHAMLFRIGEKLQAWFTYSDRGDSKCDRVAVLEVDVPSSTEEVGMEWTDWTDFPASSVIELERQDGTEYICVADYNGQLFDVRGTHDAGLHIDAEMRLKPVALSQVGSNSAPRYLYCLAKGRAGAYLSFDCLKDGTGDSPQDYVQRWDLLGPGVSSTGADIPVSFREFRGHLGRVYRTAQIILSQKLADMPPGARRDQTFEVSGVRVAARDVGARAVTR